MVEAKKPVARSGVHAAAPAASKQLTADEIVEAQNKAREEQEKADAKAKADALTLDAAAQEKVGVINKNLVIDGSPRRIMANLCDGKPKFFWANPPVPTAELTEEDLKTVEAMK